MWLVGSGGAETSRRDERGSQGQVTGSLGANGKAFGFGSENKKTLECLCKGVTESVLLLRKILLDPGGAEWRRKELEWKQGDLGQ